MGTRGPVPKRSDQRRRTNEPTNPITRGQAASKVSVPRSDAKWHPVAKKWYESLAKSGQAAFYEPSDWATAFLIAESMSRDLNPQFVGITERGDLAYESIPLKGASLGAYLKAMASLMVTEGDRRRLQVELERPEPTKASTPSNVTDISASRRKRLLA